ncbi:MAG: hypothetical protein V2J65_02280, partial [Desulfobacteraceae bacterium]|nr:hypothetical protein [Desulfobacteraceae bacterium]
MKRFESPTTRFTGLFGFAVGSCATILALTLLIGWPYWSGIFIWFIAIGMFICLIAIFKTKRVFILKFIVILGLIVVVVIGLSLVGWAIIQFGGEWWYWLFVALFIGWPLYGIRKKWSWKNNRLLYYSSLVMMILATSGLMSL